MGDSGTAWPVFRHIQLTFTRLECKFVEPLACLRVDPEGAVERLETL
jgi:hypothetical protein